MNVMAKRSRIQTYRLAAAFSVLAATVGLALLAGCPPQRAAEETEGTYLVANSKMYGDDSQFDLRDTVVYPAARNEGMINPSLNVTDQELTIYRCTWCHECGFQDAFDWPNYGTDKWSPRYVGEDWRAPLKRMMDKEDTMIQEERIVERIYSFLHDSTLGIYDESADDRGAVRIEVDGPLPDETGAAAEDEAADGDGGEAGSTDNTSESGAPAESGE
jgi:hypothetical protein